MITILVDECIDGYAEDLSRLASHPLWTDFRDILGLKILRYRDIGLSTGTSDIAIWQYCQDQRFILITDNRNHEGPDSLEEAILNDASHDTLPVLTIGNRERFANDAAYAW